MIQKKCFVLWFFLSFMVFEAGAVESLNFTILILGDSLVDGYGVAREKAFPVLLQNKLQISHPQKKMKIINSGVSGSTTASGLSRLRWAVKSKPQMVVLALGSNDGLRAVPVKDIKKNVAEMIHFLKKESIDVVLVGLKMPPNYGKKYTKDFETLFSDLAKEEKVKWIPFLLEGVAGDPQFNQTDMIHPNEKGHEKIAEQLARQIGVWL